MPVFSPSPLLYRGGAGTSGWKELLLPIVVLGQHRDECDRVTQNVRSVIYLHSEGTAIKLDHRHKISNAEGRPRSPLPQAPAEPQNLGRVSLS